MIERIVTVKETKFVDTADGKKQYLSAVMVGEGGKENKQAIFDPKLQQVVQEALKNSLPLKVKLEKEGTFWNIKEAEIATDKPQPEVPKTSWKPSKNDDDIMLQVAFKGAIELETHHNPPGGKIDTARVIQATSELFAGLVLMRPKRVEK